MHELSWVVLGLLGVFGAVIAPALLVQRALAFWFRPAEQVPLEEAWAQRFEERLSELRSRVHQDGVLFEE